MRCLILNRMWWQILTSLSFVRCFCRNRAADEIVKSALLTKSLCMCHDDVGQHQEETLESTWLDAEDVLDEVHVHAVVMSSMWCMRTLYAMTACSLSERMQMIVLVFYILNLTLITGSQNSSSWPDSLRGLSLKPALSSSGNSWPDQASVALTYILSSISGHCQATGQPTVRPPQAIPQDSSGHLRPPVRPPVRPPQATKTFHWWEIPWQKICGFPPLKPESTTLLTSLLRW